MKKHESLEFRRFLLFFRTFSLFFVKASPARVIVTLWATLVLVVALIKHVALGATP